MIGPKSLAGESVDSAINDETGATIEDEFDNEKVEKDDDDEDEEDDDNVEEFVINVVESFVVESEATVIVVVVVDVVAVVVVVLDGVVVKLVVGGGVVGCGRVVNDGRGAVVVVVTTVLVVAVVLVVVDGNLQTCDERVQGQNITAVHDVKQLFSPPPAEMIALMVRVSFLVRSLTNFCSFVSPLGHILESKPTQIALEIIV